MTYKLNPAIGKIESPVILCLPEGEKRRYQSGADVVNDIFDHKYLIESLRAVGAVVEVVLSEQDVANISWIGEEQTFF